MVIRELLQEITDALKGFENASFEAAQLLGHILKMQPSELILNGNNEASPEAIKTAEELVKRRLAHEPLQYILGSWEFMSLPFYVSQDTLIPRQDTETLVEFALSEIGDSPKKLLDIGTGTGCIVISLAYFKKNLTARGIDISRAALSIAERNAEKHGLSGRVSFAVCDIISETPEGMYDIVLSNPPYIKSGDIADLQPEVRSHEPLAALDGGSDGLLFYRRICEIAPKILKTGGLLAFEIGYDQADAVSEIMSGNFEKIKIIQDLCGNDRVAAGYLKKSE